MKQEKRTLWTNSCEEMETLYQTVYYNEWKVVDCIKVKINWRKLRPMIRMKVQKLDSPRKQSPFWPEVIKAANEAATSIIAAIKERRLQKQKTASPSENAAQQLKPTD